MVINIGKVSLLALTNCIAKWAAVNKFTLMQRGHAATRTWLLCFN